jgi:hypothetical protein
MSFENSWSAQKKLVERAKIKMTSANFLLEAQKNNLGAQI